MTRVRQLILLNSGALLAFCTVLLSQGPGPKPVPVCDVLEKLQYYRGKSLTIRGQLVSGDEGIYLVAQGCRKPLVVSGYVWPNPAINLVPGKGASVEPTLSGPTRNSKESTTIVDVTGRFESRENFEMALRGDGKTVPFGYGHLNSCPAELVYDQIVRAGGH